MTWGLAMGGMDEEESYVRLQPPRTGTSLSFPWPCVCQGYTRPSAEAACCQFSKPIAPQHMFMLTCCFSPGAGGSYPRRSRAPGGLPFLQSTVQLLRRCTKANVCRICRSGMRHGQAGAALFCWAGGCAGREMTSRRALDELPLYSFRGAAQT